jgi:hypothetical protein
MTIFRNARTILADRDDRPYVCPGCFAMGAEVHAGYCVDAAIARDREDEERRRDDEGEVDDDEVDDG